MNRRLSAALAVLAATALTVAPAHAATKKKPKPKPLHGSYTLSLYPDPSQDVTGQATDPEGCAKLIPGSFDDRAFKVPAAGTLKVVLEGPSTPSSPLGPDWDLWLRDADGSVLDGSHGETSHEELTEKFKKGQPLTFEVCNLTGDQAGKVSWTFTYA